MTTWVGSMPWDSDIEDMGEFKEKLNKKLKSRQRDVQEMEAIKTIIEMLETKNFKEILVEKRETASMFDGRAIIQFRNRNHPILKELEEHLCDALGLRSCDNAVYILEQPHGLAIKYDPYGVGITNVRNLMRRPSYAQH